MSLTNRERRSGGAERSEMRGFSLVELMTAIAMVGILSGAALLFIKPTSHAATARGYAQEVAALCDVARHRAVASRTRQMIEVNAGQVAHYQASEPGMAPATEWKLIGTLPTPSQVAIASTDTRAHVEAGDDLPTIGAGLPLEIGFAPDGTSTAATIFIHDAKDEIRARVAIYKVTGSAFAYSEW